ncbi:MAG: hypothetical protein R2756_09615 [Bacteroidales bacterium]
MPEKKRWLAVNDRHSIHHVRERGYVESPVRVKSILKKELDKSGLFRTGQSAWYSDRHILEVHDSNYFSYFKKVSQSDSPGAIGIPVCIPPEVCHQGTERFVSEGGLLLFRHFYAA